MFELVFLLAASTGKALTFSELLTPFLPLIGTIAGGIVIGAFAVWNRKRGNIETRAPDVNELWQRSELDHKTLDIERRLRRLIEDALHEAVSVFRSYVRRVQSGGSSELTTRELKVYNGKVPSVEEVKEK